jgi:hypothetical protein
MALALGNLFCVLSLPFLLSKRIQTTKRKVDDTKTESFAMPNLRRELKK